MRLFDPFAFLASARCARASARALRRRCRGFSMTSPVDSTARLLEEKAERCHRQVVKVGRWFPSSQLRW